MLVAHSEDYLIVPTKTPHGGRVRLCNLSDRVRQLMKMTRLDTVLDIFATEEDALASIRAGGSLPSGDSQQ